MVNRQISATAGRVAAVMAWLLWAGALSAQAQPSDDSPAMAALLGFADGLETLVAEFDQRTTDGAGFVVDEAEGQFSFKAPDRFRWSIEAPFVQELVADGERLWHYDESLDQVTVRQQPAVSDSPILVLTQPELLGQFYSLVASRDPEVLAFRPLAEDAEFSWARLRFVGQQPVSLELLDRFDQITVIRFADLRRNPELDPQQFRFEVPEGVDVLEGFDADFTAPPHTP